MVSSFINYILYGAHTINVALHKLYLCTAGVDGSIWTDARGHNGEQAHPGADIHSDRKISQFLLPDTHVFLSSGCCRRESQGSYMAHTNQLDNKNTESHLHVQNKKSHIK